MNGYTTEKRAGLLKEIEALHERRARGDVHEKNFARSLDKLILEYYRAVAGERLAEGETLLEEHHVVRAHLKLSQSILKESGQELISYYATDRRLLRLKTVAENGPASPEELARAETDDIPYGNITGLRIVREARKGEMLAGGVIFIFALAFRHALTITGPLMALLGILGMLHGVLLPTSWAEVKRGDGEEMLIYALRKRSARKLMRKIKDEVQRFKGSKVQS